MRFLILCLTTLDVILLGVVKKTVLGAVFFSPIWLILLFLDEGDNKEESMLHKAKVWLRRPLIMLVVASVNIFLIAGIMALLIGAPILSSWRLCPPIWCGG